MKQHEKKLQNGILMSVGRRPDTRIWRHNVGKARPLSNPDTVIQYGRPGQPDLMGLCRGRFLAIECKASGRVTPEQQSFLAMVRKLGGIAVVSRIGVVAPADLEDAIKAEVQRIHELLDAA